MKTTGYALREALKQHELLRDTASRAFDGSLKKFDDEEKETSQSVVEQFLIAERAIAKLQVAQMRFNLAVQVDVLGEKMSLGEAIKRVGGEGRAEKMWRSATGPKNDRYSYGSNADERDPSKIVAKPTITAGEATKLASAAAKRAGAFRAAIATGNAREVEIEDLDSTLFE